MDAVGCSALTSSMISGKFLFLGCSSRRGWDGVTVKVTFKDHCLEYWGSIEERGELRECGPHGCWRAPRGSAVRKGRERQALGNTVVQSQLRCSVFGRCVLILPLAWRAHYWLNWLSGGARPRGPSPWKTATQKVLSPNSHSTFKFYFK